jgi:large subunit ribosomal protein L24
MARIKRDDTVQVITGKHKGQTGRVLKIFPKEEKCTVEKVNVVKRHQKAKSAQAPSGIVEKTMKIAISNVMPFDAKAKRPSRIAVEVTKDGKRIRKYKSSGQEVAGKAS